MTVIRMSPSCAMASRPDSATAFDLPYTPRGVRMSLSLNGRRSSVLPAVNENGADKDKLPDSGARSAARQVQGALDIGSAIKFDRVLLIWMMNTRRQVNNSVHANKSALPVGCRPDGID